MAKWEAAFRDAAARFLRVEPAEVDISVLAYQGPLWFPLGIFIPNLVRHRLIVVRGDQVDLLAARAVSARPKRTLWTGRRSDLRVGSRGRFSTQIDLPGHSLRIQSPARDALHSVLADPDPPPE